MNNTEAYFNQLHFSSDLLELYRGIDRLINFGNFEAVSALRRFFLHTSIKEAQLYIIKKIPDLNDLKSKFRLLIEFSYSNDNDLKIEVLESINKINHPVFSHRLFSIYLNTDDENKKMKILKMFINDGISLFKQNFLAEFKNESLRVQHYILTYLVNTPFLSDENCYEIINLVSDLLDQKHSKVEEGKLLHNLWLLSVNNPVIAKASKKVLQKSRFGYSLLYHLYQVVKVDEIKHLSNSKVIEALYQSDYQIIHRVRFSKTFIKSFVATLDKKLMEIEADFHAKDNIFIWNLIRLNHQEIVSLLIDVFKRSTHFNFKQAILDILSFFHINEDLKERLKPVCIELFEEKDHSRIFESLSRNLILLFGHEGLQLVYDHYERLNIVEQKTQVLSGIMHAIMDFGFGKSLTALDNYTLNMILGNSIDYAMSDSKMNSSFISKIFQIINLLQVDGYVDEMLMLAKKNGINLNILGALLSLNNEKIADFILGNIETWTQNLTDNRNIIQLTLSELSRRRIKGMEAIEENTLTFLLEQPAFTSEVISYLEKYQRTEMIKSVLKFHTIQTLTIQYSLCQLIGKYQSFIERDIVKAMFRGGEVFIKKKLSPFLMSSSNKKLIEQIYTFYIEELKDIDGLRTMLEKLPMDLELIGLHLSLFPKIKSSITSEHFSKIKQSFSEHLYFYLENKEPKPNPPFSPSQAENLNQMTPDNLVNQQFESKPHNIGSSQGLFKKDIEPEANRQKIDLSFLIAESEKVFEGYKSYLINRKNILIQDGQLLKTIEKVFLKPTHYQEFIKKSGYFNKIQLKESKLTFWINELTNHIELFDLHIKTIEDLVHIYAMLLHKNDFYSIDNPLKVDLDYFYNNKIIEKLYQIHEFKIKSNLGEIATSLDELQTIDNYIEMLLKWLLELNRKAEPNGL